MEKLDSGRSLNLFRSSRSCKILLAIVCLCVRTVTPVNAAVNACSPSPNPVCTCRNNSNGLNVECNNMNPALTEVPAALPEDTKVLNLQSNSIRRILRTDFMKLESLRTLFLQQNNIAAIEEGSFDNLYKLKLLVLGGNRLTYIQDLMFRHLPSITTLDLSNNQIAKVDKRAFLTLPASSASSGRVTIQMSNNNIYCGCDDRAIRDWKRSLGSSLAQIQIDGYQCMNAERTELDSVRDEFFANCTRAQRSMFETTQTCVSCRSQVTQHGCDVSGTSSCQSSEPVCQSEVKIVNGKLSINKSCGTSYTDCLLRERNNNPDCSVTHSRRVTSMQCTFCCAGTNCSHEDVGGRTSSYDLFVGLRMAVNFQSYMLNPSSARYIQEKGIYEQKLNELFQIAQGGYDVEFLSFRNEAPNTFVTVLVHTTNLNTFTVGDVVDVLLDRLNVSANSGWLSQRAVTYLYVGTELSNAKKCMREVTTTAVGNITWQEAWAGSTANALCPSGPRGSYATRKCVMGSRGAAQWEAADIRACRQGPGPSDTTLKLTELNNTAITPNNVNSVLQQLGQLTVDGSKLTADDVNLAMDTVDRALAQPATLTDTAAMGLTVNALSNLVDAEPEILKEANQMRNSAGRLLAAADKISAEGRLSNGGLMLSESNLVVAAQAVRSDNFNGLSLTVDSSGDDKAFQRGDVKVQSNSDSPTGSVNSLVLPPSLMTSAPGSRVAMTVHRTDKVFEAVKQTGGNAVSDRQDDAEYVRKVNSHVMAASVVGRDVTNLPDPVVITLFHDNENSTNPACVFWDVAKLEWSSRGCRVVNQDSNDNITTCECDHLTNFALLMDVYGQGLSLSDADKKILSIISYIGCGVSLMALLLTLLTYFLFKKLRRDNPSKILVNLCASLALSNLVFVAGMQPYALNDIVGCKIVAVLLHFSLLSSLCWMAVEAFYMYLALVLVFKTYFTNFILKCSLVGYGIPLVIVIVTLSVNETDNYGPLETGVCWLKDLWFYGAFVGPVCLILLLNFIAFGLVLRQIYGLSARKLNKSDSFTVAQQLRGAIGVAILLGLTWIFAVFAIDQASVVFYYLFAIFNSLQGLWIFLFYCVLKKEARNAWLRALPCCHTVDDKSGVVTTSKAGYSATGATHGGHKSATDTSSNGRTTSTAVTASRSFSDLDSEMDNSTAKTNHVYDHINQGPTTTPAKTAYRTEGSVAIISTGASPPQDAANGPQDAAKVMRAIQFYPGKTLTEPAKKPAEDRLAPGATASSPTAPSDDPRASPRPLHFKLGHAYSLEPKDEEKKRGESRDDARAVSSPTDEDNRGSKVAAMIKKLDNTRL